MKPQDDISINPGATYPNLCEFTVKERNIEFKAVLAYESKK
ncbi:type I toxin-antitoxin system Hok family toxin [Escherichia coli]|nr:type I toxin-antitoxin system Hok family toxin [Escherichia coli]